MQKKLKIETHKKKSYSGFKRGENFEAHVEDSWDNGEAHHHLLEITEK